MPTYYIVEKIDALNRINQPGEPEGFVLGKDDAGYLMVESTKWMITRKLKAFKDNGRACLEYSESCSFLHEDPPMYEKVNLWKVSALVSLLAAKKILGGKGELLRSEEAGKECMLSRIKGDLLLDAYEGGASGESLQEISQAFDQLKKK